ncbi:MAG: O-antigen ligase family protein [Planctomycetes bacterium]|nr:O-antigen ligase family protein [Planctomycetota bacterium]
MIGRLHGVSWYAFLGALWLRTCVPSHLFEPNADAFADLALGTCALAAIACALLAGDRLARGGRGAIALLALAIAVAAALTRDPERRLHAVADGAGWLLAFCCAATHARRAGELFLAAVLAGGFAGLLSFHQSTGQLDLYMAEQRFLQVDRGHLVPTRETAEAGAAGTVTAGTVTAERAEALLGSREPFGALQPYYPNALGGFLLMLLPLHAAWTLALFRAGGRPSALALHGLLVALEAWGLAACGARGVWIAGLLAACFLAGARVLRLGPMAAARALALLLVGASIASPLVPPSMETPLHFRAGYWRGAGRAVAASPWLGHGTGQYPEAYMAHQEAGATFARHAHQDLLQMAVEGGLLLPAAFLLLACGALARGTGGSPLRLEAGSGPGLLLAILSAFAVAWRLPGAIPHTSHSSVETLFAAAAAISLAGTIALTCPRGAPIDLPPALLGTARWGTVAALLLSLGDHPLHVPGIALLFMALAGTLAAEPPDASRLTLRGPAGSSHAAAALLLAAWMVWAWGWALPEATVPYEHPEGATATPEDWRRVRRETPGRTSLREIWAQAMSRVAQASGDEPLLAECEKETDALLERQPDRGQLWTLKISLSRRESARSPETYDAAQRLVACFPATPGPHALRCDILEEIAHDPERVEALARAWEIPPHAALSELLLESAESAREALDLDPRVPGGERHRRLTEGQRETLERIREEGRRRGQAK